MKDPAAKNTSPGFSATGKYRFVKKKLRLLICRIHPDERVQGTGADGAGDEYDQADERDEVRPWRCDHIERKYGKQCNPDNDPDDPVNHANILFTNLHTKTSGKDSLPRA